MPLDKEVAFVEQDKVEAIRDALNKEFDSNKETNGIRVSLQKTSRGVGLVMDGSSSLLDKIEIVFLKPDPFVSDALNHTLIPVLLGQSGLSVIPVISKLDATDPGKGFGPKVLAIIEKVVSEQQFGV